MYSKICGAEGIPILASGKHSAFVSMYICDDLLKSFQPKQKNGQEL